MAMYSGQVSPILSFLRSSSSGSAPLIAPARIAGMMFRYTNRSSATSVPCASFSRIACTPLRAMSTLRFHSRDA
ncbi:hypothetical protein D3C81_1757810 [compost metagenome]